MNRPALAQSRISPNEVRVAIAEAIATHVKSYDVAELCESLGLPPAGPHEDPNYSKRVYVKSKLQRTTGDELVVIGRKIVDEYGEADLEQVIERYQQQLTARNTPASKMTAERLARLEDWESVQRSWNAAADRISSDPEGAITAARTMLEGVCKHICDERGVTYESGWDLSKLYKAAAKAMDVAPDQHGVQVIKQILSGVSSVVEGLASMRNSMSDAHGRGKKSVRPGVRHAKLAINSAYTVASFLIDTHVEKRAPNPASPAQRQ